jgi:hypothetical protein
MKAVKENKVYTVNEAQKSAYLAQGYDITDDNGEVIERSPSSAVSRVEYDKLSAELEKTKAELAKLKAAQSAGNNE